MNTVLDIINIIVAYMESLGTIGVFVLIFIESIVPVVPLLVIVGLNVTINGLLMGYITSYFATVAGCMASFILFRTVFRNLFYKLFKKKTRKKVEGIMQRMSNIDFNALVILIACPFTPAFLINIAGGLSNIKSTKFFISILIGKLASVFIWCYIGDSFKDALKSPIMFLKVLGIILIAYVISKIIEKIVKVEE